MTHRLGYMIATAILAAVLASAAVRAETQMGDSTASGMEQPPLRIACWFSDGGGMQPTGDLERFLVDRLSATGERVAVEPSTTHAILRILGFERRSVFDPVAARKFAEAAKVDWVVWVKLVSRDVKSQKTLSIPYLYNRWKLDANVFIDVRVLDAETGGTIGSKRLKLTEGGDATGQILENERLDPAYDNDPVELHERMRRLDWRAAAAISGYCADLYRRGVQTAQTDLQP